MTLWDLLGKVAFFVGIMFAFIGGIWGGKSVPTNDFVVAVLLICGILIAFLNITVKESATVLIATVALVVVSIWGTSSSAYIPLYDLSAATWENTVGIVSCLAILMFPAAVIVAIKAVLAVANRD